MYTIPGLTSALGPLASEALALVDRLGAMLDEFGPQSHERIAHAYRRAEARLDRRIEKER